MPIHLYRITNVPLGLDEGEAVLRQRALEILKIPEEKIESLTIARRALDARKKADIHFVCHLECTLAEALAEPLPPQVTAIEGSALNVPRPKPLRGSAPDRRVIVVGSGPAGLFAALSLAEAGVQVTLLERGKPVESRMRDIGRLRSRGELNPESNICFGEGGAGTYTDGKLYTRIKHPFVRWVLATFVRFGARPDILVDAHPHLGTDKLVRIVRNMRHHLQRLGVDYRFEARVDDLLIRDGEMAGVRLADGSEVQGSHVILATGHSARDTYARLQELGIPMQAKPFAIGVRAEHPQALIDSIQFGAMAGHAKLGAAEYALTCQLPDQHLGKRGVYSFCMCPGGLIVPSPTEPGRMAVNGMSNAHRSGLFANSGIVVQVTPEDIQRHGIAADALCGVAMQRELEAKAFAMTSSPYAAPAMRLDDFVQGKASGELAPTRFKPLAEAADLKQLFPAWLAGPLTAGLTDFGRKMRGYVTCEANLLAVESRTSSPVQILRSEDMQSIGVRGLYPVGEGAGHAGGIVSAAVDGLKAAANILGSSHAG